MQEQLMITNCPKCGNNNELGSQFCRNCGGTLFEPAKKKSYKITWKRILKWIGLCLAFIVFVPIVLVEADYLFNNWYSPWNKSSLEMSISRANEIAYALKSFKKENGSYPNTLEELVPKYIPQLLLPKVGKIKKWNYSKTEKGFYLEFGNSTLTEPVAGRTEEDKSWMVDTK